MNHSCVSGKSSFEKMNHSSNVVIFPCDQPSIPTMDSLNNRLRTFGNWPNHILVTKQDIAEAGFFYLGDGDRTKCFYCNLGLQNWKFDDNPWFEHAKWRPNCEYLLARKGFLFVSDVTSTFPHLDRPRVCSTPPASVSNAQGLHVSISNASIIVSVNSNPYLQF